MSESSVNR